MTSSAIDSLHADLTYIRALVHSAFTILRRESCFVTQASLVVAGGAAQLKAVRTLPRDRRLKGIIVESPTLTSADTPLQLT